MSMQRRTTEYRLGTGVTSMLMIFIVLCLTTLSILSLSAARTDLKMTRYGIELTKAYYEAADQVQEILSEIDAQLIGLQKHALDTKTAEIEKLYADAGYEDLDAMREMILKQANEVYVELAQAVCVEGIELTQDVESGTLSFSVDAGNERVIQVQLALLPPGNAARYRLTKHVMAYQDEGWAPEFEYELYQESDDLDESMGDLEDSKNDGSLIDLEEIE